MSISLDDIIGAALSLQRGNNGGGKPPSSTCVAGHDKAVHGIVQYKNLPDGRRVRNGYRCAECKRRQQRKEAA